MIKPSHYDGMVSTTADRSIRFRVYEPTRWQLWRKLLWCWWWLRSRLPGSTLTLAVVTITVNDEHLDVRVVAEPEPEPTPRRDLEAAAKRLGARRH